MRKPPLIWLTRPHADSLQLAENLALHGIHSIIAPVIDIAPKAIPPADIPNRRPAAILLTSRHGAQALAQLPRSWHDLPTYCVGEATATTARSQGFAHITTGEKDVHDLLRLLKNQCPSGSDILYLCGKDVRVNVADILAPYSINLTSIITYEAVTATALPDAVQHSLTEQTLTGVTFFSPRSARIACQLLTQHGLSEHARSMHAYCLSSNVANAAATLPWASLHTCAAPTTSGIIDLIVLQCKKLL